MNNDSSTTQLLLDRPVRDRGVDTGEDTARITRAAQAAAPVVGVGLLVIAGLLALTLPSRVSAEHWAVAWVGLDMTTAAAALLSHRLLRARDPRAAISLSLMAGLLVADAWFDIWLSPGPDALVAIVEAAAVELPLAGMAAWTSCRLVASVAGTAPVGLTREGPAPPRQRR